MVILTSDEIKSSCIEISAFSDFLTFFSLENKSSHFQMMICWSEDQIFSLQAY